MEIAAPRLIKEPSMALYSRPPEVWVPRQRFELLKTVLVAVRGHRGRYYQKAIPVAVDEFDINLVHTTNDDDNGEW